MTHSVRTRACIHYWAHAAIETGALAGSCSFVFVVDVHRHLLCYGCPPTTTISFECDCQLHSDCRCWRPPIVHICKYTQLEHTHMFTCSQSCVRLVLRLRKRKRECHAWHIRNKYVCGIAKLRKILERWRRQSDRRPPHVNVFGILRRRCVNVCACVCVCVCPFAGT